MALVVETMFVGLGITPSLIGGLAAVGWIADKIGEHEWD